jgi:hypothetical protein
LILACSVDMNVGYLLLDLRIVVTVYLVYSLHDVKQGSSELRKGCGEMSMF